MRFFILLTVCSFTKLFSTAAYVESLNKEFKQDCVVMTMHKSGTHLFLKLMDLLGDRFFVNLETTQQFNTQTFVNDPVLNKKEVVDFTLDSFNKGLFVLCHVHFSPYFYGNKKMSSYPFFILVRDLRDICVSAVHYIDKGWPEIFIRDLGRNASFDDKLMWVITAGFGMRTNHWANFASQARELLKWRDVPNTYFFYYEDLCGEQGGGAFERQVQAIWTLAKALDLEVDQTEVEYVAHHLYGPSQLKNEELNRIFNTTLRQGQIGSWKDHFKKEHIEAFKLHMGQELIELGYETDENW